MAEQIISSSANLREPSLVWGGADIARFLGVTRRKAYFLLESGHLAGSRKIGGSWCLDVARFRASFDQPSEAA